MATLVLIGFSIGSSSSPEFMVTRYETGKASFCDLDENARALMCHHRGRVTWSWSEAWSDKHLMMAYECGDDTIVVLTGMPKQIRDAIMSGISGADNIAIIKQCSTDTQSAYRIGEPQWKPVIR